MIRFVRSLALTGVLGLLLAATASAQYFPLSGSTASTTATENTAPFLTPIGVKQTLVTNRNALNAKGLAPSFGIWDMIEFDPSSRYIFIPSEVSIGGGLARYDTLTDTVVNIAVGNGTGIREANPALWNANNDEFSRIDPSSWSPAGTVIFGEETTGGRLFEVLNPLSSGSFTVVWRSSIPAVAHEGLRFDQNGNLYFIDEDNSGSIYKFVPTVPGDLSVGQTFVLSVNAYASDPSADATATWNSAANLNTVRTGTATWIPMTDAMGNKLTTADPFAFVTTTGGRSAADELKGTPYGRPEDVDFGRLANGKEVLYVAVTSENAVYSIELVSNATATVRIFADRNSINEKTGAAVGTHLTSPDNLAVDAYGHVYIIEDNNPGDIFMATDANQDGVAESIALFSSLGVSGSEPSGMIFDPNNPDRAICCVQHPSSGNDAIWAFDLRPYNGTGDDLVLAAGINGMPTTGPARYVRPAKAFEQIIVNIASPNGSLVFSPVVFFYDLFLTGFPGSVPGAPFLHVDLPSTVIVIDGSAPSLFAPVLPPQGLWFGAVTPPGLAGFSVMLQSAVWNNSANNGIAAVTDGQEIQFIL